MIFSNTNDGSIHCLCLKCGNCEKQNHTTIGMVNNYLTHSYARNLLSLDTHMHEENDVGRTNEMIEVAHEKYSKYLNEFEKLLNDVEKPLYEGCKRFTKLSTLIKLYNLKVRHGWSDISFSELLKIERKILPTTNVMQTPMYEANKTLGALGINYKKIHACPNDCCLYRKEYANGTECPECGESRWKYANNVNKGKK